MLRAKRRRTRMHDSQGNIIFNTNNATSKHNNYVMKNNYLISKCCDKQTTKNPECIKKNHGRNPILGYRKQLLNCTNSFEDTAVAYSKLVEDGKIEISFKSIPFTFKNADGTIFNSNMNLFNGVYKVKGNIYSNENDPLKLGFGYVGGDTGWLFIHEYTEYINNKNYNIIQRIITGKTKEFNVINLEGAKLTWYLSITVDALSSPDRYPMFFHTSSISDLSVKYDEIHIKPSEIVEKFKAGAAIKNPINTIYKDNYAKTCAKAKFVTPQLGENLLFNGDFEYNPKATKQGSVIIPGIGWTPTGRDKGITWHSIENTMPGTLPCQCGGAPPGARNFISLWHSTYAPTGATSQEHIRSNSYNLSSGLYQVSYIYRWLTTKYAKPTSICQENGSCKDQSQSNLNMWSVPPPNIYPGHPRININLDDGSIPGQHTKIVTHFITGREDTWSTVTFQFELTDPLKLFLKIWKDGDKIPNDDSKLFILALGDISLKKIKNEKQKPFCYPQTKPHIQNRNGWINDKYNYSTNQYLARRCKTFKNQEFNFLSKSPIIDTSNSEFFTGCLNSNLYGPGSASRNCDASSNVIDCSNNIGLDCSENTLDCTQTNDNCAKKGYTICEATNNNCKAVYKRSNPKFSTQGAVSGGSRINRLKYQTKLIAQSVQNPSKSNTTAANNNISYNGTPYEKKNTTQGINATNGIFPVSLYRTTYPKYKSNLSGLCIRNMGLTLNNRPQRCKMPPQQPRCRVLQTLPEKCHFRCNPNIHHKCSVGKKR